MIPKTPVPQIATDATWASGPESGQPTRFAVPLSAQKQGILAGSFPAANMNGLLGPISDHVSALSEISVRNWSLLPDPPTAVLPMTATQYNGIFAAPVDTHGSKVFIFGSSSSVPMMGMTRTGVDWSSAGFPGGTTNVRAMASNGTNRLICVGSFTNRGLYSTDQGVTWAAVSAHSANDYISVCYSPGLNKFLAVSGSDATVGIGTGDTAYVATTTGTGGFNSGIRAGAGSAVLTWSTDNKSHISSDGGVTWATSAAAIFPAHTIADIQYSSGAGIWMAINTWLDVATSPDGVTWTTVNTGAGAASVGVSSLATDGSGVWVTVFANTLTVRRAYSVDNGVTWKEFVIRDFVCYTPYVCYSPQDDRFYMFSKDTTTTVPAKVLTSLCTGTAGGALG